MLPTGQCWNCRYNKYNRDLTLPPSPGGYDSVLCISKDKAAEQDSIQEYEDVGYVHLYRIEIMDEEAQCQFWQRV